MSYYILIKQLLLVLVVDFLTNKIELCVDVVYMYYIILCIRFCYRHHHHHQR